MRFFDFIFSLTCMIILIPLFIILYIIGLFDTGSPIFKQVRLGKHKKPFIIYKFRSMHLHTQSVGTHEISSSSITKWGIFLRQSKFDELPQLWNVLVGDMSLVGPRPNLLNQKDLIEERDKRNVYSVRPGITGLSQINKIDMSTPTLLAETDASMIKIIGLRNYFNCLIQFCRTYIRF